MHYHVIVVGASLAGSTSALIIAREGLKVLLVDQSVFPRRKPCGEGLAPAGLSILQDLGLWRGEIAERSMPLRRCVLWLGEKAYELFSSQYNEHSTVGVERLALDNCILQAVAAEPTSTVLTRCKITKVDEVGGGYQIVTDDTLYTSDYVVIATGCNSALLRRLQNCDVPKKVSKRVGVSLVLEGTYLKQPDAVNIIFHDDYELYCTPVSHDRLNVAILGENSIRSALVPQNLRRIYECIRNTIGFIGEPVAAPIGSAFLGHSLKRPRRSGIYFIGDAYQTLDPLGGRGMSFALKSARMVADELIRKYSSGSVAEKEVDKFSQLIRKAAVREWAFTEILCFTIAKSLRKLTIPVFAHSGIGSWYLSTYNRTE